MNISLRIAYDEMIAFCLLQDAMLSDEIRRLSPMGLSR